VDTFYLGIFVWAVQENGKVGDELVECGAYLLQHHAPLPIRLCDLVGRCCGWYIDERVKRGTFALRCL